ncbi:MAG: class I SAM-dependent methyltransferase [Clostridia bacterium]|nr:class I SAM-dependent methyltransferase [Clostridia bacterium]
MGKEIIPFWEKTYQEKDIITFSVKPNPTVKEFENLLSKQSKILEAGCGEGQNAIYLAQQGYCNTDAFDLSENAIAKVKHRCQLLGTQLNAYVADMTTYQFEKNYDMIICFGTLHFLSKDDWKNFLNNAKLHTNIGGIHIMQIFTDSVPASEDIAPFAIGLAKDEEIIDLYKDWEVLQFKSYIFEDEHPGVPKHLHASNKIVVRRFK